MKPVTLLSLVLLPALLGLAGASLAQSREYTVCAPQKHQQNWSTYVRKYQDAERALACAGYPGLAPKQTGGGSQCIDYVPHPAVKHAAEVDAPVRGRGAQLCGYIEQPQNAAWYERSFSIKRQPRSR